MPTSASTKRTSTPVKRATKAVTRVKPAKPRAPESDVEVVSEDADAGTFTARVFGTEQEFTFYTDVNFMMLLISYGGDAEGLTMLPVIIKSLLVVDEVVVKGRVDNEATDAVRHAEWMRFVGVLATQRGMNSERSMKFINDLIAAAGKDQMESVDD